MVGVSRVRVPVAQCPRQAPSARTRLRREDVPGAASTAMSWGALLSILAILGPAAAEWVEIPQFSDQRKVYRPPLDAADRRVYQATGQHSRPHFHEETSLRNISKFSGNRRPSFMEAEEPPFVGTIGTFTTERVVSSIVDDESELDDAGIQVESPDHVLITQFHEIPLVVENNKETSGVYEDAAETTTTPAGSTTSTKSSKNPNETSNDKGFLDYLPIDLLKRVHKTLKSQPPTLKGKIRFLKAFERTLLSEIESRLNTALAPIRKPRGARDHDDHDDGIGFPSLEGTLMAISFLTFAVYLVRLVMMLFRNTAPIVIGRKKRSVDDFSEETARILSYLDSPLSQQFSH